MTDLTEAERCNLGAYTDGTYSCASEDDCNGYDDNRPGHMHENLYDCVTNIVKAREAAARREALLAFADTRGVNVGDEHGEWWQGYRQAQRECLHDATDAALAEPTCATCGHPDHGSCGCTSTVDYDQRNDSNECTCPGPLSERDEESGR